jgi:hypothetical protein
LFNVDSVVLSGDAFDSAMFATGGSFASSSTNNNNNNNNTNNNNNSNNYSKVEKGSVKGLSQGARQRLEKKRKNAKMPKGGKSQKSMLAFIIRHVYCLFLIIWVVWHWHLFIS